MDAAIIVERGFAIGYIACGIAIMLNPAPIMSWFKTMVKSGDFIAVSFVAIYLGAFIIAAHNIWEASPRVITTLIGWIALFKGVLYMAFPQKVVGLGSAIIKSESTLRMVALFPILLGGVIYYYSL